MSQSRLRPSAANTSAAPDLEETARLPCLAVGTPQAAVTKAAAVEMLYVPVSSPPVPQVSMAPGGASTETTRARMTRAPPVSSSTVSPRTRSAIKKAPICAWPAPPDMMISKAVAASSSVRPRPWATTPKIDFIAGLG